MLARKDKIVDTFTGGIALLFKKNKVASHARPRQRSSSGGEVYQIEVKDGERVDEIEAQHVIIATGSVPRASCPACRSTTTGSSTTSARCR